MFTRVEHITKQDKKTKRVVTGHTISANSDVFRIAALTARAIGCDQFRVTFIENLKQKHWSEVKFANVCNAIFRLKQKSIITKQKYDQYINYWNNNNEENVPEFMNIVQLMKSRGFNIKEPVKAVTKRLV